MRTTLMNVYSSGLLLLLQFKCWLCSSAGRWFRLSLLSAAMDQSHCCPCMQTSFTDTQRPAFFSSCLFMCLLTVSWLKVSLPCSAGIVQFACDCWLSPELSKGDSDKWFLGKSKGVGSGGGAVPLKPEAPACATARTESADCQWREGNQCRLAPLSCSSVWFHFLENQKRILPPEHDSSIHNPSSLFSIVIQEQAWSVVAFFFTLLSPHWNLFFFCQTTLEVVRLTLRPYISIFVLSHKTTNPCDPSDIAGWVAPRLLSCA